MAVTLVPFSWKTVENSVQRVKERLERVSGILDRHEIPYAVIGGNAVAAWVARVDESAVRNTRDVDLLLRRDDLAAARKALEAEGFCYRQVPMMGQKGHLDLFLDQGEAKVRDAVHLLFADEVVRDGDPVPAPSIQEIERTETFNLISLEALVRTKLVAFRTKDKMHLYDMIEVGLIDQSWPSKYHPELAAKLQELLDHPE